MKIKEDEVVENEGNMKKWIENALKEKGYSRTHLKVDYFRACKEVVSDAARMFGKRTDVSQFAYRAEASMIIMDYVDPLF